MIKFLKIYYSKHSKNTPVPLTLLFPLRRAPTLLISLPPLSLPLLFPTHPPSLPLSLSPPPPPLPPSPSPSPTHLVILISSDCCKLSAREQEGPEIIPVQVVDVVRLHHVKTRLVLVHTVHNNLQRNKKYWM